MLIRQTRFGIEQRTKIMKSIRRMLRVCVYGFDFNIVQRYTHRPEIQVAKCAGMKVNFQRLSTQLAYMQYHIVNNWSAFVWLTSLIAVILFSIFLSFSHLFSVSILLSLSLSFSCYHNLSPVLSVALRLPFLAPSKITEIKCAIHVSSIYRNGNLHRPICLCLLSTSFILQGLNIEMKRQNTRVVNSNKTL